MLGVYIHIPFCVSKCKYCDFTSGVFDEICQKRYFAALENEMRSFFADKNEVVDTVFIGGGTPSSVDAGYIVKCLDVLRDSAYIKNDAEISIEMNPGTVTSEKCSKYVDAGINRFSIGLQSHDDELLKKIGRIHTRKDFENTLHILNEAGAENINADVIYALPSQSAEMFTQTAEYLCSLPLKHISSYALKIEEGTALYNEYINGTIEQIPEDIDREMYYAARDIYAECGFMQYEISNFAKSGYECRHNLKYWTQQDYIGFGAGAHSCVENIRFCNTSDIEKYILNDGLCVEEKNITDEEDRQKEFLMLRLRLTKGFALEEYEQMFSCDFFEKYGENIKFLIDNGFIKHDNGRIFLSEKGMDVQNAVLIKLGI